MTALDSIWEALPEAHRVRGGGPAVAARRDSRLRRALALGDIVGTYAAVLGMLLIADRGRTLQAGAILIAPLVVLFAKVIGLYDRDQHLLAKGTIDEIPRIFYLSILSSMTVWLGEDYVFTGWLSRVQVFVLVIGSFLITTSLRALIRGVLVSRAAPERCVVLGDASDALRIRKKLEEGMRANAVVVGRVLPEAGGQTDPDDLVPLVATVDQLAIAASELGIERVIIALSGTTVDETLDVIRIVRDLGLKVSVLPRLMEVVGSSSAFDDVEGTLFLGLRSYGLSKSSSLIKRTADVVAASAVLVLLLPLCALIMLAIKLDSRGPLFFRQRRIGSSGQCFDMMKFRSMIPDAERVKEDLRHLNECEGGLFKIARDPRITRVGGFLRKTSLDELPQLINVLRGEMSLVGPRPLIPDEDALIDGWKRRRLAVKPGMTGQWQILGSARIPMDEMVKIDYMYGANWSLWLDLKILLRTVPYVLRRGGA